jgi:hypothetical protein
LYDVSIKILEDRSMNYEKHLKLAGYRLVGYRIEKCDVFRGNFVWAVYVSKRSRNPCRWFEEKFLELEKEGRFMKVLAGHCGVYSRQEDAMRGPGWILIKEAACA